MSFFRRLESLSDIFASIALLVIATAIIIAAGAFVYLVATLESLSELCP